MIRRRVPAAGTYQLKLKATNSAGSVTQTFTLTVDQPPAVTSAATYSVKVGGTANQGDHHRLPGAHGVTQRAVAQRARVHHSGQGHRHHHGVAGRGHRRRLRLRSHRHQRPGDPGGQTSPSSRSPSALLHLGDVDHGQRRQGVSFGIDTTGYPTATIAESGALPTGVQFSVGTGGTATLSGDPASGTGGTYQLKLKATNSAGSVTQTFTLTVDQPPAVTSAATYSVKVGGTAKFKVTTTGYPAPTVSLSVPLPSGLVFTTAGKGTATITGSPAAGTGGVYAFEVIATNGQGPRWSNTSPSR